MGGSQTYINSTQFFTNTYAKQKIFLYVIQVALIFALENPLKQSNMVGPIIPGVFCNMNA